MRPARLFVGRRSSFPRVRRQVAATAERLVQQPRQSQPGQRELAVDGLYDTDALRLALPWLIDHVEEAWRVFGKDFWAYGQEPNRPTFEAVGRYVHEQGLSPRVVSADELFAPGVE